MHIIAKRLRLSEAKEVVIGQRMDSRSSSTLINPGEGPGMRGLQAGVKYILRLVHHVAAVVVVQYISSLTGLLFTKK